MIQRGLMLAAILLACLSLAGSSFGADNINADVLQRLKALEDKNNELEARLKQAQARPSATAAVDKAMAAEDAKMGTVVTAGDPCSRPLLIGGYMDVGYEYNLGRPDNGQNNLRVFDQRDTQGFDVHLASLNFSRLPEKPGQAGFRVDLDYGTDLRVYKATDGVAQNSLMRNTQFMDTDLRQAYIEYIVPLGCDRGITMDAGKFVTWAGAEVIQASDNMNSSRGILFGFAIPFTHTGVRASYDVLKASDCGGVNWTVAGGIVNGWDNIQATQPSPTGMFMSDLKPVKWFDWTLVGIYGSGPATDERDIFAAGGNVFDNNPNVGGPFDPTGAASPFVNASSTTLTGSSFFTNGQVFHRNSGTQGVLDTVLTFTPFGDNWTFVLNGDFGTQDGIPPNPFTGSNQPHSARWWGGAAYVKYQFLKNWYVAARGEYFADDSGVRTGTKQDVMEGTITLDWAMSDPMHMRFEYRHDNSNADVFASSNGPGGVGNPGQGGPLGLPGPAREFTKRTQDTIGVNWLYKW